jgi:hypothetical protein
LYLEEYLRNERRWTFGEGKKRRRDEKRRFECGLLADAVSEPQLSDVAEQ